MNQRKSVLETFYRGALCVYIFVLVLIMYTGTNDPTIHIKELLTTWTALCLAGSYLLITWVARIPLRRPPIFRTVLLCLIGLLFVSSLFSEFRAISLLETGRFFSFFALYWLASQVFHGSDQVARFFTIFCIAVFIAALYAVVQAVGIDPFPWKDTTSDTYTNLPATYGNPNYAAHALILAIIMVIGLYRMGLRWTPWLLPLLAFHLYSTDQRAGWIALAGALTLVVVGWLFLRHPKRPVLMVTLTLSLFTLLGVGVVAGALYWTQARTGHAFPLDLSLLLRYQSYVSATNMLLDAPILGHGPAVYGLAYAPYWTPFEQDWFAQEIRMNGHVHNDLIELGIDGGLAAAGLYLCTLLLGICYGLLLAARGTTTNQRRLGFVFAAFFTAFAIDGLFGFNLRVPVTAALFFLMLGLLDGIWAGDAPKPERQGRWKNHAFRLAFLGALILAARQETKAFAGEYYFYAGMKAHSDGKLVEARASYEKAEEVAPWNWHAPRRIGMTFLDEGKPGESRPHFERSLKKNPYYLLTRLPMARADLMMAQEALKNGADGAQAARESLEEARGHARFLLEASPRFPAADELLGRVESIAAIIERDFTPDAEEGAQQTHWAAAQEHLHRAIDNGSEHASALYRMLMRVELGLRNQPGAEQAILRAVQTAHGDGSQAWALFMNLARKTGNFDPMRDALYRQIDAVQRRQENGEASEEQIKALGTAFDWLATVQSEGYGDSESALDACQGAVISDPLRPKAWSRLADLAYKNGKVALLEETITTTCSTLKEKKIKPLPQVEAVYAVLVNGTTQLDQASRVLLAGVRSHPPANPVGAKDIFGWAARMLTDRYRDAAAAGKAPCESALNLAIVAAGIQEFGVANELFQTASGCLTGERKAILAVHWADTMLRTGRRSEALTMLEESARKFPKHLDTQWAIARTLAQLGRISEARERYAKLLSTKGLDPEAKTRLQTERDALPQQ